MDSFYLKSILLMLYSECVQAEQSEKLLDRGGNQRTRDLWFASPMVYQLVRSKIVFTYSSHFWIIH